MTRLALYIMTAAALATSAPAAAASLSMIPQPVSMHVDTLGAYVAVPSSIVVGTANGATRNDAENAVRALSDAGLKARRGNLAANLHLIADPSLGPEAYKLASINEGGFELAASSPSGFYYGATSLAQLLKQGQEGQIPPFSITDEPRFGYRGMMLDVVRCYQPFDEILRIVDVLASLKINTLHLHLTDDNGWRMEIKSYPKLTEVGAWRVDYPDTPFPSRPNTTSPDTPATYGGYYTQKQLKELVRYAADRHIQVIPEIEMPAHAAAAIASYPELACPTVDKYVGVFPGIGGRDASIIICAGNDEAISFFRNVLDEVMDLFPSQYIHLGGDEANKTHWDRCPRCLKRMADNGISDSEHLQGWFMDTIASYVRSHGREVIGWDEVAMGHPSQPMTIMGWRGDGTAASKFSMQTGSPFIMTPSSTMYLIRYQGPQWFEPLTYFGNNRLLDVYGYEPVKPEWPDSTVAALRGIQGSLWTEFCRTPRDAQYLIFPRMVAIADAAWRPEGSADWPAFLQALDRWLPELDRRQVAYARSMYNPQHYVHPMGNGTVEVTVTCERPDVELRWGTDSAMSLTAPYDGPLALDRNTSLHVSTFGNDGRKIGQTLSLDIDFNLATGHKVQAAECFNGLVYVLTNGLRGSLRDSDFEWAKWHDSQAQITVDLGRMTPVNSISLGTLANIDFGIAGPAQIYFYVSDNGIAFDPVGQITPPDSFIYSQKATVEDFTVSNIGRKARYIRVVAVNPGGIPNGLPREGIASTMCFDEIIVK